MSWALYLTYLVFVQEKNRYLGVVVFVSCGSIKLFTAMPLCLCFWFSDLWYASFYKLKSLLCVLLYENHLFQGVISELLSYQVITIRAQSLVTNWEIIFIDTSWLHSKVAQLFKGSSFWHWLLFKEVKSYSLLRLLMWLGWFSVSSKPTCFTDILLLNIGFWMSI